VIGSGQRRRGIQAKEDLMLVEHEHRPGVFDPGHCRNCAREADLLDHYWRVQREERAFREAHWWARRAYRQASWALWCSGLGIVLAMVALLAG
jgi:hypothetical protein